MKPLYYFKLNKETGELKRTEITNYEEKHGASWSTYSGKHYYRWKQCCYMYCYQDDLDRYKSGHVYSFDGDFDHAYKIVQDSLFERMTQLEENTRNITYLFNLVHNRGMKK